MTSKWCSATYKGARDENEDRYSALPPLFAVHDGHAGAEAVNRLQTLIQAHVLRGLPHALKKHVCEEDDEDGIMNFLTQMYEDAQQHMCEYRSGAVSLSAIVQGDHIYMANIGDCEACIFDSSALDACSEANPVCIGEIRVTDTAIDGAADNEGVIISALQTQPHALRGNIKGWRVCHTTDEGIKYGIPTGFDDLKSQREWELASKLLPFESIPSRMVDIPYHDVKTTEAEASEYDGLMRVESMEYDGTTYSRFMSSVEPTRSLGDSHCLILRGPEIYRMRLLPSAIDIISLGGSRSGNSRKYLAMCTDGFFDGNAFEDIRALVSFLSSPLSFIRRRLYHPMQSATQRLIAARHLPRTLATHQNKRGISWLLSQPSLFKQWRECDTWGKALLLLEKHIECLIKGDNAAENAAAEAQQGEERWATASLEALQWIKDNVPRVAPSLKDSPKLMAETAVRMAVIMGSTDNVTLVITKLGK